jgi:hypothetical protein
MAVVAIAGDDLIAILGGHLHADDDRFLADIEMAEAADQAHAVHLAGLLLEAADQQHLAIGVELFVFGENRDVAERGGFLDVCCLGGARFRWLGGGFRLSGSFDLARGNGHGRSSRVLRPLL